ncbi:MAG: hypothetical protein IKM30_04510, partial [Oscillospiraceae bacterium]|nr:hypothetical protein [Oscillospiraceae bacterium]
MKRFISALSSLCLAATTVISAFPVLSASAAGSADWTIGKKTVSGGVEVSVPVTVNGDKGTSGFIADLAYDSALTFSGITWGNAYTGEATIKEDEVRVVWADNDGENQTAADDAVVFYLNFTAPAASGEYPITIDELEVVDTDGDPLTISSKEGAVIVKQTVPAGSVGWDIAEKTVAGGSEVSVPVTVTGDKGTSGFIADFEYNTALKFTGITWGKAYTGEATINDNELRVVWADNDGNDQTAADDAVVLYLNFTAPAGSGRYPVTFSELSVVNTDGGELTLVKDDGAVIVSDADAGSVNWEIDEKIVDAGAEVKVPVTVTGDAGTSGFIADFSYDDALTFTGFTWGDAYTGEATINEDEIRFVWADDNGDNQTAADDAVVLYLNFTAPDEAGTYEVTFDELSVVNTNGGSLAVTSENGAVIVKDPNAGSSSWDIGEETVKPGAEAKVPVIVTGDEGTSGFVVDFEYDDALTFTGITWGEAYTGEATLNENELRVVWADNDGDNQTAADDAVVLYLNFTAPDEAGEYPVTFGELEVVDTNGAALTLVKEDGAVIVEDDNDETTTTAPIVPGTVGWYIGEETVAGGTEAKVPVTIKGDAGTAGFVVDFDYDDALTFEGITWGEAYTGEATVNGDEVRVVWADDDGDNQTAADDAIVLYLNFTAPDEDGEYPVTFNTLEVVDGDGNPLTLVKKDGAVIVVSETTTTPGETTTTVADTTTTPGETTTTVADTTTTPTPGETTTTVADTTTTPGETTTTVADTTTTPGETTTTVADTTTTPGETTTTVADTTTTPGETTTTVADTTTTPGETTTTVADTTTTPGETTT